MYEKITERFASGPSAGSMMYSSWLLIHGVGPSVESLVLGRLERMAEDDIRHFSMDELVAMRERGETQTKEDAQTFEVDQDFWKDVRIVEPRKRTTISLRIDPDILDWFKAEGKGHLTRINAVLRSYVEAQKHAARR